jgi:hypothetical protein
MLVAAAGGGGVAPALALQPAITACISNPGGEAEPDDTLPGGGIQMLITPPAGDPVVRLTDTDGKIRLNNVAPGRTTSPSETIRPRQARMSRWRKTPPRRKT